MRTVKIPMVRRRRFTFARLVKAAILLGAFYYAVSYMYPTGHPGPTHHTAQADRSNVRY